LDVTHGLDSIGVDRDAFAPRHQPLLLVIALSTSVLVLLLAAVLGARLQRRLQRMRAQLESALGQQALADDPFGALAELLDPPAQTELEPALGMDESSIDRRRPLYLVVVNLFNQISLSHDERSEVLERCEALLDRVCRLYGGRHERLPGTGLVIVLDALSESGDHAFQAICAALLATRVFEDLNLERRRNGAVQLALRIGVERIVDDGEAPDADMADAAPRDRTLTGNFPETVNRAVTLSALARERTIAIGDAVHGACSEPARLVTRPLQSPVLRATGGGSAWLVEDLAESYSGLLDRQAQLLLSSP
jgi:class 3 adenylate cyclase